ncbi:MAG: hypothetical protein DRJ40_06065 [Thermoprotei archaeon]|nr:MAG: hypothetical protein DRJ40_06065 [Thermoprotei archaeon]
MVKRSNELDVVDKVLSKAERLINEGRVVRVSDRLFYVIGDHMKYFVRVGPEGPHCMCEGFKKRGFCSHSIAVMMVLLGRYDVKVLEEKVRERLLRDRQLLGRGRKMR